MERFAHLPPRPPRGWVRAIRSALGMSMRQVAERAGVASPSSVVQAEEGEQDGGITLRRLRTIADAMGCDLVYALVPREGSLQATIHAQAVQVAQEAMLHAHRHMILEAQGVGDDRLSRMVEELADELERGSLRKLWDHRP